jgi:hypothetical protein
MCIYDIWKGFSFLDVQYSPLQMVLQVSIRKFLMMPFQTIAKRKLLPVKFHNIVDGIFQPFWRSEGSRNEAKRVGR